ncbi:MAG TPA: hypothetical protein VK624_06825 [Steroidobacteraceae bacterium]|jgi:hypothetical protein|nr:hypothetical protein [Steroidobacteraceae bacterium]
MLERDARRKYLLELGASMAIYILVLFGALSIAKPMPEGALRTALLLTPMIPIALAIWAIARQFRRMDEFIRLRTLESLAIAAAVTAGLSLTYGFLEGAGFPRLSMFWVWPVMGFVWGGFECLRCVVKR